LITYVCSACSHRWNLKGPRGTILVNMKCPKCGKNHYFIKKIHDKNNDTEWFEDVWMSKVEFRDIIHKLTGKNLRVKTIRCPDCGSKQVSIKRDGTMFCHACKFQTSVRDV